MLHAEPELGFCEIITADLAWRVLSQLGWTCHDPVDALGEVAERLVGTPLLDQAARRAAAAGVASGAVDRFAGGRTGFVAELQGSRAGPCIAVRIDLDALPVTESSAPSHAPVRDGFASAVPGIMHACGHDGHVALALRLAAALSAERDFPGSVRLILQPAEEGVRGADPMVNGGVCEGVDVLIGLHLGFGVPTGAVAAAEDLLATTKYRVQFTGRAAHAARAPEKGRNALLAAADVTLRLHDLALNDDSVRVNVGSLRADGVPNIVPSAAMLTAEVRASDGARHRRLEQEARVLFTDVSAKYGVGTEIVEIGRAETTSNDPEVVGALERASAAVGAPFVGSHGFGASDDASIMMNRVRRDGGRAMYALFGAGDYGPHHSPEFDIDEQVLELTARTLEEMIRGGLLSGR